jgi:hypothetical protein
LAIFKIIKFLAFGQNKMNWMLGCSGFSGNNGKCVMNFRYCSNPYTVEPVIVQYDDKHKSPLAGTTQGRPTFSILVFWFLRGKVFGQTG